MQDDLAVIEQGLRDVNGSDLLVTTVVTGAGYQKWIPFHALHVLATHPEAHTTYYVPEGGVPAGVSKAIDLLKLDSARFKIVTAGADTLDLISRLVVSLDRRRLC